MDVGMVLPFKGEKDSGGVFPTFHLYSLNEAKYEARCRDSD